MKSLFSQRKRDSFEENKMLVRDKLDNMIVTLTAIMDSHECPLSCNRKAMFHRDTPSSRKVRDQSSS